MHSNDIKIFSELLSDDAYCLLYNGHFIDAVTSKIINITKVSLIQRGELIRTQNRFAYLIAECFQNIIRHGGHKQQHVDDEPLPGFFMAKIKNNFYDIVTGNLIANANIFHLKNRFEEVNALNGDELKALYNKTLAEGKLSDKGGAGLGLIDMAKKTAQNIEYRFLDVSPEKSMFYQRLVMTSTTDILERKGSDHHIDFGIKLHTKMIERNILVLQKSDFSRNSVLPMLKIVEENIISKERDAGLVKVIYQILFALIQNVNHHDLKLSDRKEGLFLISKQASTYSICSGYYIDKKKVGWLKDFIENISKVSNQEIEKTYLNGLNTIDSNSTEIQDIPSLDLGKIIKDRFRFSFYDMDEEASFFNIYTRI